MRSSLNPYINFGGNAREAMTYYQSVLSGELAITTFGEAGMVPDGVSPDGVMHAQIVVDGKTVLMGSDGMDQSGEHRGFSVSLSGDDVEELHGYWEKFATAGTVVMPMAKQQWGDEFGMLKDQFGVDWMIDIAVGDAKAADAQ